MAVPEAPGASLSSPERGRLLDRKRDLLHAIKVLQGDRAQGLIEEDVYRSRRDQYEREAALVLKELDASGAGTAGESGTRPSWYRPYVIPACLVATFLLIFAFAVTSSRRVPPTPASRAPATISAGAQAVALALERVAGHPRNVGLLVALGDAYLHIGNARSADRVYQRAMEVDRSDPAPATLHALMLSSVGNRGSALAVLRTVERSHPRYSRAWLLDGMLSSRAPHGYVRALSSWNHFLRLEPRNPISPQVRRLISGLRKTGHRSR